MNIHALNVLLHFVYIRYISGLLPVTYQDMEGVGYRVEASKNGGSEPRLCNEQMAIKLYFSLLNFRISHGLDHHKCIRLKYVVFVGLFWSFARCES